MGMVIRSLWIVDSHDDQGWSFSEKIPASDLKPIECAGCFGHFFLSTHCLVETNAS